MSIKRACKLSLSVGIVLTLIVGLNKSVNAQTNSNDLGYQSNEKDNFSGGTTGLNPLDLIHRSQQLGGRSEEEFKEESRQQINGSASDFKQLQQQRILEQQPSTSVEVNTVK